MNPSEWHVGMTVGDPVCPGNWRWLLSERTEGRWRARVVSGPRAVGRELSMCADAGFHPDVKPLTFAALDRRSGDELVAARAVRVGGLERRIGQVYTKEELGKWCSAEGGWAIEGPRFDVVFAPLAPPAVPETEPAPTPTAEQPCEKPGNPTGDYVCSSLLADGMNEVDPCEPCALRIDAAEAAAALRAEWTEARALMFLASEADERDRKALRRMRDKHLEPSFRPWWKR